MDSKSQSRVPRRRVARHRAVAAILVLTAAILVLTWFAFRRAESRTHEASISNPDIVTPRPADSGRATAAVATRESLTIEPEGATIAEISATTSIPSNSGSTANETSSRPARVRVDARSRSGTYDASVRVVLSPGAGGRDARADVRWRKDASGWLGAAEFRVLPGEYQVTLSTATCFRWSGPRSVNVFDGAENVFDLVCEDDVPTLDLICELIEPISGQNLVQDLRFEMLASPEAMPTMVSNFASRGDGLVVVRSLPRELKLDWILTSAGERYAIGNERHLSVEDSGGRPTWRLRAVAQSGWAAIIRVYSATRGPVEGVRVCYDGTGFTRTDVNGDVRLRLASKPVTLSVLLDELSLGMNLDLSGDVNHTMAVRLP